MEWIKCIERLPEKNETFKYKKYIVNVVIKGYEEQGFFKSSPDVNYIDVMLWKYEIVPIEQDENFIKYKKDWFFYESSILDNSLYICKNVVAWMPLPEPPKD